MGCPPVRGDNPRALASGLSYVQVDKHGITFFYTTYICVDLAHDGLFHAKVGKGGIISFIHRNEHVEISNFSCSLSCTWMTIIDCLYYASDSLS